MSDEPDNVIHILLRRMAMKPKAAAGISAGILILRAMGISCAPLMAL